MRIRATATSLLVLATLIGASPGSHADIDLEITVLSGRPDTVTGGDALVQVDAPRGVALGSVRVAVDDTDVTDAFHADATARTLTGLVDGLADRAIQIRAWVRGRPDGATVLDLTNHPIEGPVISGPHQQPYACETASFTLPIIGGTLGEPIDADCSIETRVDYFYRTDAGRFAAWPEGAADYPSDLAWTTTWRTRTSRTSCGWKPAR